MAIAAPAAEAANVRWVTDRSGGLGLVVVQAAAGENNDLLVRGADGPAGAPTAIVIEDSGAPITTSGSAAPGDCDTNSSCNVPCRIETPNRARCVIDDGFTTQRPVNPFAKANHWFQRSEVYLEDGNDRVATPLDGVSQAMRVYSGLGDKSFDFVRGSYIVWASSGDTIKFGPGASGGAEINGTGVSVEAVNGASNYAYCYGGFAPKLRFDLHDSVGYYCTDGDIVPPANTLPRIDAPPSEDELAYTLGSVP